MNIPVKGTPRWFHKQVFIDCIHENLLLFVCHAVSIFFTFSGMGHKPGNIQGIG